LIHWYIYIMEHEHIEKHKHCNEKVSYKVIRWSQIQIQTTILGPSSDAGKRNSNS
jgi:hypothetical protein